MFANIVKSRYRIMSKDWSEETYWSCFAYDEYNPDDLHCTHKFFGTQPQDNVSEITKVIDGYFEKAPFQPARVIFDKEAMFGEDKDVRVLKANPNTSPTVFLPELRGLLNPFAEDNFPTYEPHVTTDLPVVQFVLTRYCLCQGDRVIQEWG